MVHSLGTSMSGAPVAPEGALIPGCFESARATSTDGTFLKTVLAARPFPAKITGKWCHTAMACHTNLMLSLSRLGRCAYLLVKIAAQFLFQPRILQRLFAPNAYLRRILIQAIQEPPLSRRNVGAKLFEVAAALVRHIGQG